MTRQISAKQTAGFSLIEMLVVVSIIALMMGLMLPSMTTFFELSIETTGRTLSSTIQQAYNAAAITGNVYRLAYDLDNEQYWVEYGPPFTLLETKESLERKERRERFQTDKPKDVPTFTQDKTITRTKVSLPRGVLFKDIESEQSDKPITQGLAYAHYFPHGLSEQSVVHFQDTSNHTRSLITQSLLGTTDWSYEYVSRKKAFEKNGRIHSP